jgi:predicted transcriptional regulator
VPKPELTDREIDVMNVLWDHGPMTVSETREQLPVDLAYTTVLTVLRGLEQKRHVDRSIEGRAHRYRPRTRREDVQTRHLRRSLKRIFRGSPEALVAHLVTDAGLTDAEIRRLRQLLDKRLRTGDSK